MTQARPAPEPSAPVVIPSGTLATGVATTIVREEEPFTFVDLIHFVIRQWRVIALA